VFGAGVAAQVLAITSVGGRTAADDHDLTDREREVLSLIAEGSSNAQIARALGLSLKTVQNYVSRILDKLQLADRTQAALFARDRQRER
jgi:DNA-binding NarL/FixJ family response regulator